MLHFLLSFCKSTLIDIESTTTHSYFYPINRMMKSSLLLILNSLKSHLSGGIHKFIVEYGHGNYLNQTCFKTATWVLRQRLEKAIIRDGEAPPNKVLTLLTWWYICQMYCFMIELWNSLQFKAMQCSSTNQYKCTKRPHPRCVNPGVVVFSTSFAYFLLHHHISVELNCGLDTYQAVKEVILIIAYFRIADWKKCFIQLNFALKDIAKQSWLT